MSFCPGWGRDTLEEALHRFEAVAKRTFCGNEDDNFHFPVLRIADNAKAGVCRGQFCVTGREMKEIFNPVLQAVHDLVKDQVRTSSKNMKTIFLVGGYVQSPYLRKYLRDHFALGIEALAPVNGWTAVMRGALIKTVREICASGTGALVESRVARRTMGSFGYKRHLTRKCKMIRGSKCFAKISMLMQTNYLRFWDKFDGIRRITVMEWLIQKVSVCGFLFY